MLSTGKRFTYPLIERFSIPLIELTNAIRRRFGLFHRFNFYPRFLSFFDSYIFFFVPVTVISDSFDIRYSKRLNEKRYKTTCGIRDIATIGGAVVLSQELANGICPIICFTSAVLLGSRLTD